MLKDPEPKQQVHNWKKEIRLLLKDFRVAKETINKIISDTKKEANPSDDDFTLYNKAWNKAIDVIMDI